MVRNSKCAKEWSVRNKMDWEIKKCQNDKDAINVKEFKLHWWKRKFKGNVKCKTS